MSTGWNFARAWRQAAGIRPDAPALIHGSTTLTWSEWDSRAGSLGAGLRDAGLRAGDHVAVAAYNCPEYLEAYFACFRYGMVPVNTNFRYQTDELVYLWDNADIDAVVFHGALTGRVAEARARLPRVRCWIWLDDGTDARPEWAVSYDELLTLPPGADDGRDGDDVFLLYTGGTTGRPKGVVWRQDDFYAALHRMPWSAEAEASALQSKAKPGRPIALPGAPLMHGTGLAIAWSSLDVGGSAITLPDRHFNPPNFLRAIEKHKVTAVGIVGDAFATPLIEAFQENPGIDLASVRSIISSGVMWSRENKQKFLAMMPRAQLADLLGSSEAMGAGRSITTATSQAETAQFRLRDGVFVLADDGTVVTAGSGRAGRLAMRGPTASGYYKDEALTAATFFVHDGERLAVTGDYVTVAPDGTIRLLGRGNMCINSGGEKIFPEEVEEVIKLAPGVLDVAVVGVPDPRLGEVVCAVVQTDGRDLAGDEIVQHVKQRLAGYKAPKHVLWGDVWRLPNGKLDYRRLKSWARDQATAAGRTS